MSLLAIPKESTPDIKFGIVSINTIYLWVSPTDIDQLITEEIEQQIKDISWIKKISSSSRVWVSSVTVELDNDVDVKDVMIDIKDELDKVDLPTEAEDPLVIEVSSDNESMFDLILYTEKDISSPALLKQQARTIKDGLSNFGNVSSIDIQWGDDFDVQLILNKAKMEQMGLSLSQITSSIRAFNQNIPLGNYQVGELSYDFRIQWEIDSVYSLLELPVIWTSSQIRIQDIADINYDYTDESIRTYGEFEKNGFLSTRLTFNKQIWTDIFSSSTETKEAIEELLSTQEFANTQYTYTMDMSESIKEDYASLANSGLQTLVFVFICLVFFVWLKESFIATLAIPLAFLITFIYLNNSGSSLNFMTNFSLVLTLGIAIDTTIVIIEWASEKLKLWYNPKSAILLAVRDYHKPLIAGTLTTLVVFIPMMVLPGITWKFLSYIPITVFSTLVAALFISLTLNSALFYKLSKKRKTYHREPQIEKFMTPEDLVLLEEEREGKQEKQNTQLSFRERILEKLNDTYENLLRKFISKKSTRRLSVIIPILILFFTFTLNLWFTLFPQSDNSFFSVTVTWKVGTNTQVMEQHIQFIENILKDEPEIESFTTRTLDNSISVNVDLLDKAERKRNDMRDVFSVESDILSQLWPLEEQWLKVASAVQWGGPPAAKPVWLKLIASQNSQFNTLQEVAAEFEEFLGTIEWTKNVSVSSETTPWQFVFTFDHEKLEALWLTPNDVTRELSSAINGVGAWSVNISWEDRDIKVVYEDFIDAVSPTDIEQLTINTRIWPLVIGEVLDYSIDNAVGQIAREDTKILVRVDADVADGFNGEWPRMQAELVKRANTYNFPNGISFDIAGEAQENADLIWAAFQWLFISIFVIFGILVLQFNSFSKPVIIMYSVICALLWVNIWLRATWNSYSMAFGIWFIALTGIVVNDAIILIDRINQNIAYDTDIAEAIIEAWRSRLQPIILTTLTTLLWVLPISLQDKFWEGLWFTMIFWLFAGSAMTLFVIPSLYHIVFVKKPGEKKTPLRKRLFRKKEIQSYSSNDTWMNNTTYTIE